jgi:Ran GTPase-activating protein (RanGAP) involved in mRNA processing and transport
MGVCVCVGRLARIDALSSQTTVAISILQKRSILTPDSDSALGKLQQFYAEERVNIPKKVDLYYKLALEGDAGTVAAIVVKVSHLGARGIEYLCRILPFFGHIAELRLWKVGLDPPSTDRLSYYIPFLIKLQRLSLEDNSLNDEAVENLCRAFKNQRELRELWLACNNITLIGANFIGKSLILLPKLEVLNLDFNSIEDEGCKSLCVSLCKSPRLKTLSLEGNGIGAGAIEELYSLAHRNAPEQFTNLKGNKLRTQDCARLAAELGSQKVDLGDQF